MKRINLYSTLNKGGPWFWAKNIYDFLNECNHDIKINLINSEVQLLLSSIYQTSCDIVHSVNPIFIKPSKPYVLSIHGDYNKEKSNNFYSRFYKIAVKKADIITVPSLYLKNILCLDNAVVIPNSIDLSKYHKVQKRDLKVSSDILFCTITNFNFWEKCRGIIDLVDYLNNFNFERDVNVVLHIGGVGKYLDEVKRLVLAKSSKINIFFDHYVNTDIYFGGKDIFLYCSYLDTFSIVLLEAMASGISVLSNDFGPTGELLEKDFIFDDEDDFYVKLNSIIEKNSDINFDCKKWDNNMIIPKYHELYLDLY